ncbi:MAG TPA: heparinase II/III family protein [Alphaproteobacteria bacterium]
MTASAIGGLLARLETVVDVAARRPGHLAWPSRARLADRLRALFYATPFYSLTLVGRVPERMAVQPPDPWPGSAVRGDALFQGRYRFAGHEVSAPKRPVWLPVGANAAWLEELHAFEWLRDFKASGGNSARRHARALIGDWLGQFGHWRPLVWRADVQGRRIAAWAGAAGFLLNGAEPGWRRGFLASLSMQLRHLARTAQGDVDGARRIAALRGLLYGGLCLGGGEARVALAVRGLVRECRRQVLADGGHLERSPRLQRRVLGDLADCRALLRAANRVPPEELTRTIDRMAPMLRALCHGDGGLAQFNNSGEGDAALVAATLALAEASGSPQANAPHVGFQRLAAGGTVVIVDCGAPYPGSDHAHAGTLAVEMSAGSHRLVVNCGPHSGREPQWVQALCSTAAHSTLVVADTSSSAVRGDGSLGRRPLKVACRREQADGAIWLDASHDGYAANFGLIHRRRLYLESAGGDLRGEDSLFPSGEPGPPGPQPFAVRFHLHPSVQASLVLHGQAALFRLADGSGWQLRAHGGSLALNASVYIDADGERRRCEQAVIAGVTGPEGTTVKWAITRVAGS